MKDYFMPETPITDAMAVTNADRIRAMSDEELAEQLVSYRGGACDDYITHAGAFYEWEDAVEAEVQWLKQPSEEETQTDCTYNKNGHCMGQKLMPECDAKNCDRRK